MENTEFRNLVKLMRATQTEYFATASRAVMLKSKELELLVDQELGTVEIEQEDQLKLFK